MCPAGYYCPEGTGLDWKACPRGTYSATTGLYEETQCNPCDAGKYCDGEHLTAVSGEIGLSGISNLASVNGASLLCLVRLACLASLISLVLMAPHCCLVRLVCLASIILLMLTADFASTGEIGSFYLLSQGLFSFARFYLLVPLCTGPWPERVESGHVS